jgi:hypothetical protein
MVFPKLTYIMFIIIIPIPSPFPFRISNYATRRSQRRSHNCREQEEIRFPPFALRNPLPLMPKYPGKRSSRERAFDADRIGTIGPG